MRLLSRAAPLLAGVGLLFALAGPVAAAPTEVLRLTLTGDVEATPTCAPPSVCGDPDATGVMILIINPNADMVCFVTKWADIDGTVVASHIHLAPVGVPGPVVIPLFSGTFDGTDKLHGCVSANGLADDILANPSAYYVNIHSSPDYPAGAIRAQLG